MVNGIRLGWSDPHNVWHNAGFPRVTYWVGMSDVPRATLCPLIYPGATWSPLPPAVAPPRSCIMGVVGSLRIRVVAAASLFVTMFPSGWSHPRLLHLSVIWYCFSR